MLNIFMKLYFGLGRFLNIKKYFYDGILQLIILIFSILLLISDGVFNTAISVVLIILSFIASKKFIKKIYGVFKSFLKIIIERLIITGSLIVFFASLPLIVRIQETNGFNPMYLWDNFFSNLAGAFIVISILYKFRKINSNSNNLETLFESNADWFMIFLFGFVDSTLLIIDNYTMFINSKFDIANTIYLGIVIFIGFYVVSLYLSQISGKQPLNIDNKNSDKSICIYPFPVLVCCFFFLLFHIISFFGDYGKHDYVILFGNTAAISIVEIYGYVSINKYILFSDPKMKKIKNCKKIFIIVIVAVQALASLTAIIFHLWTTLKNDSDFKFPKNDLNVCITVIAIAVIVCTYLNYTQNKNQFAAYVNKEKIFKIIDEYVNNKEMHKELIHCSFFDKCECKERILTIIKAYIIMYLFKLNKSQMKNEILNNNKMQEVLKINTNSDDINEIINQAECYGEETQYSDEILENIIKLIKENNLKEKYVISVEYIDNTKL